MYIDFKISTWERVRIDDSIKEEVLTKLRSGEISSSSDLYRFYTDDKFSFDPDIIYETSEQLSPEENNGMSTIEVYDNNHSDIWNNLQK